MARPEPDFDRLDEWSNAALDAIEAGRFDEAEGLCNRLLREFPSMIDGPERLAALRAAQGRWLEAAETFDRALAVIAKSPGDYDPEGVRALEHKRDDARARARATQSDSGGR